MPKSRDANALPPVLYQDEALLVLDKPSGLLTVPDRWDPATDNLVARLHEHGSPDWTTAHRLDKDTSGVVVCAKTHEAAKALREVFDTQQAQKSYLALVRPAPAVERGEIAARLGPDDARPGRMRIRPDGRKSATLFEVLESFAGGVTLVRLRPRTGRTHQLRIHMAYVGSPIVCDEFYGDGQPLMLSDFKRGYKPSGGPERPLLARLALHAESIRLPHPLTGEPLTVSAEPPKDFAVALKQLRRWAR